MHLRSVLALVLLSSVAAAQQVTLRGKVEDGPGRGQFLVDCTNTALTSSNVNLNLFNGQHVQIKGVFNGAPGAPSVDVVSIQPVAEIFELRGNPEVGAKIRFGATYTPGTRVAFHVALKPGFRPVSLATGTFFLDRSAARLASGVISQRGNLELELAMPNDPTLVGQTAYAQAVLVTNGKVILSNPDCKVIR